MRSGGSKSKGASFERETCVALSLWLSNGVSDACLWRSAMSGGRATIGKRAGKTRESQSGDISAVSSLGHKLTDRFSVECKFYKDIDLESLIYARKGKLAEFWKQARADAAASKKQPMLIAKQNRRPALVMLRSQAEALALFRNVPPTLFNVPGARAWLFDSFIAQARLT